MQLPTNYGWLESEGAPRHLLKALELFGTQEKAGPGNNPVIMAWAKELGISWYNADAIPWCGLFVAVVMNRAGRKPVNDSLRALSWETFGVHVDKPMLGDVLVFTRSGGGHVGLYVGEDAAAYHVLGGNQGDAVSIVRIAKTRMHAARRPAYTSQPLNIRRIFLQGNGSLSQNEN